MTSLTEKRTVLERKKLQLEGTLRRLEKSLEKTRGLLTEISAKRPRARNAKVLIHKNKDRLEILEFQEKQEWKKAKVELVLVEKEIKEIEKQETKYHHIKIGAGVVLGLMVLLSIFTVFFSNSDFGLTGLLVGENLTVENVSVDETGALDSTNLTVNASLDAITGAIEPLPSENFTAEPLPKNQTLDPSFIANDTSESA